MSTQLKWPEGAIDDWQSGASYGQIEKKYGRAYSTVAKLIRGAQVLGTKRMVAQVRKGGRPPLVEQKPLSYGHHSVGIKLNRYREIDHSYTYQEMADRMKVNRLTVRKMELGLHDFTVRDLQKIATVIGSNVEELVKPFVSHA